MGQIFNPCPASHVFKYEASLWPQTARRQVSAEPSVATMMFNIQYSILACYPGYGNHSLTELGAAPAAKRSSQRICQRH